MELFDKPWFLLLMIVLGLLTHWLKQLALARSSRTAGMMPIGLREYWLTHWPETLIALTSAAAGVALLYELQYLTAATAWGAGYLGNSAADLVGGRVQAMINAASGDKGGKP